MRVVAVRLAGLVIASMTLAVVAFGGGQPVHASSSEALLAGPRASDHVGCAASVENVHARIQTTSPALTVAVKNNDPTCPADVTLAIWQILNRGDLTVVDVVSLRRMMDDGQVAAALAIIDEVVTKSNQAIQEYQTFTIPPNTLQTLTLTFPNGCIDGQVDAYLGHGITSTLLDAGIRSPQAGCSIQGCTPGYWKNHTDVWNPYTGVSLESVFDVPDSLDMDANTLLEALGFGGGPGVTGGAQILFRAGVAALLNSVNNSVNYPLTQAQVVTQVNAALATNNRDTMLALATTLDNNNNLGCPLN